MLKRKMEDKIRLFMEKQSKALLITGARQTGKTHIIRQYAKDMGKNLVEINFLENKSAVSLMDAASDSKDILLRISALTDVPLEEGKTLIFFDEVQECPEIVTAIKFLVEDGKYQYLLSGSLLGVELKDIRSVPVGYMDVYEMYPLDFEEFCWALGEDALVQYIKNCFEKRVPLEENLHHKAMLLFKQYMLIGGMPMSVSKYLENNRNFAAADAEKRDILTLYENDINKADAKYRSKVASIFVQIPAFLSKHEKRVRLSNIEEKSSFPMYQDTFFWLGNSMIANECFNCSDPNVGLSINEDRTYIKCYMGDTGLLVSHTFTENEITEGELYKQILHDNLSVNEGMLFENAIAQELVANGYPLFFYTHYNDEKHRNDIEIDFIISNGSKIKPKIFPIEVKSGKKYTTKSLENFMNKYQSRIGQGYIIHTKNLCKKGNILCIPSYMTFCL